MNNASNTQLAGWAKVCFLRGKVSSAALRALHQESALGLRATIETLLAYCDELVSATEDVINETTERQGQRQKISTMGEGQNI